MGICPLLAQESYYYCQGEKVFLPENKQVRYVGLKRSLTQIAQLQTIAERNTGRASVLAKGVLCFFFDICYDDEDQLAEDNGDVDGEHRAKRTAVNVAADAALNVHPNPTSDLLYIDLSGAEIANITLYDLQGRIIYSPNSPNSPMNMRNVPAGVYVLRVTGADGREYHRKIVKK